MKTIFESLSIALEHHKAGHRQAAEQIYQQILSVDPHQPDAIHLLGVLAHELGRHELAAEHIRRAISLRGDAGVFHVNLGNALKAQGKSAEAIASYRRAIELKPDFAEAHNNLGSVFKAEGRLDEAVACYRKAIALRPDFAEVYNNLGAALSGPVHWDEADASYRRALALRPDYAEAHNNLGTSLEAQGKLAEAIASYRRALALKPDYEAAHYNLGNALNLQQQAEDAIASYQRAIHLRPDFAEAYNNLANVHKNQGRLDEAIAGYRRAVELQPGYVVAHFNLGAALHSAGNLDEAIACCRRALELQPDFAEALNTLGIALKEQERLDEAANCYRQALAIKPDFVEAQLNAGDLREELGELSAAAETFRAAIAMRPEMPRPHARLATLLRGRLPTAELAALEARLADPDVPADGRAELAFALAHVLDVRGEFDRAAHWMGQANALRSALQREDPRHFLAGHEQYISRVIEAFDRGLVARLAGAGHESRRMVFVMGLPRSGTSLIEQILASHARIQGAGELSLMQNAFDAIPTTTGCCGTPLDGVAHLDGPALRRLGTRYLEQLSARGDTNDAERVVDKLPDNYLHLGMIAAIFPQATIIHCRRDLRDVAVSCWITDFVNIRWANDVRHMATRMREYLRLMQHWRETLPMAMHEVRYEEVVADVEGVARRLVAACGLEWDPACLQFDRARAQCIPRAGRRCASRFTRGPSEDGEITSGRWGSCLRRCRWKDLMTRADDRSRGVFGAAIYCGADSGSLEG